jgi:hypothetical protein
MALEKELATYRTKLPQLLGEQGRFVVIHGDEVAGTWQTYEDALQAAYKQYGLESFLVKRIEGVDRVQYFTRNVSPCP